MKNWQKIATRLIVLVFVVGLFISQAVPVFAVTRELYWVGGTADWNGVAGTKWSLSDGGASGEAIPDSDDNVHFTAWSGAITVSADSTNPVCLDLDFTGFTGTFEAVGVGTPLVKVYGSLIMDTGVTINPAEKPFFEFYATTAGHTVTTAGKTMGTFTFAGVGGEWTLQDNYTSGSIVHTGGSLITNNKSISNSPGGINSTGNNVRSLTLGSSTINSGYWNASGSNLTLNAGTSSITVDTSLGTDHFKGLGLTYYNVTISNITATPMTGQNTFNNLTLNGKNLAGSNYITLAADQIVTGAFVAAGYNSYNKRLTIKSDSTTGREIRVTGSYSVTNCSLSYIYAGGALIDWDISAGLNYDLGHNLHILFSTGGTMYWVGNTGSTSDINHWASSSGGPAASAPRLPTILDTIIFDANSILLPGRTVTVDYIEFGTINTVSVANTPTFTINATTYVYGDLLIGVHNFGGYTPGLVMSDKLGATTLSSLSNIPNLTIDTDGQMVTLANDLQAGGALTLTSGYLDFNDYSCSWGTFTSTTTTYDRAIYLGSGTLTLNDTAAVTKWSVTATNYAQYCETSTIVLTSTGVNAQTFAPGVGRTFNNVTITGTGAYTMTINEAATFGTLTITRDSVKTVKFPTSKITTITGDFVMTPSGVVVLTLVGTTAPPTANVWTVSKATGFVGTDYLSLEDSTALGGAVFYAGSHSTFVSHVTGWLNSDPGAPTVTTSAATSITGVSAILNGNLTSLGGYSPVYIYFEWGYTTSYGYTTAEITRTAIGIYDTTITIAPATTYHYRATVRYGGSNHNYGVDQTISPSASGNVFTPLPAIPDKNRDAFIPTGGTDTFLPADAAMAGTGVPGYVLVHLLATTGFAGNDAMAWAVFILILGTAIGMLAGIYLRRAIVVGVCFSMLLTIFLFIGVVPLGWAIVSWILTLEMGIAEARSG